MSLSDEAIISILMNDLLPDAIPAFRAAKVVDSYVIRCPQAVNWFSPGSYVKRPPSSLPTIDNLAIAGDWVNLGKFEHGSKGLCQERAYVTGIEAANSLSRTGALGIKKLTRRVNVIPIRDDELQVCPYSTSIYSSSYDLSMRRLSSGEL